MVQNLNLVRKLRRFQVRLDDWLLGKQIVQRQDNYQKFIILSRSRVGSNFLASLLQSHPKIRAFAELFQSKDAPIYWDYHDYPSSLQVRELRNNEPIKFIDEIVFRQFPKSVSAVGFKLFYYQAQEQDWKIIWEHLHQMQDLKVIHLKRNNLLKVCLSRKLAQSTNNWVVKNKNYHSKNIAVELNYNDCLQVFEKTRKWENEGDNFLLGHQRLNIIYENLVKDTPEATKEIQRFLGVKYKRLYSSTQKQSSGSLSKVIKNYYQLKEKFQGTPWIDFFSE